MPDYYNIPDGMEYKYMIWLLAEHYKISPAEAGKLREADFWMTTAFTVLEQAKMKFLADLKSQ